MITILIADDHPIVRRGLKDTLTTQLDSVVCIEAGDAEEALLQARNRRLDLLLLDVTMPGRSGLDVLTELKRTQPRLPVLMLSMHSEDQYAMRVLKAGASGYLNKQSAAEELLAAVHKVLSGGRYVSSTLGEKLALGLQKQDDGPLHERLSLREFEVLRMIASGKTVSQIAEEMHLGITTVSTYRARILEKMQLGTTAGLMHYAMHNHLVE